MSKILHSRHFHPLPRLTTLFDSVLLRVLGQQYFPRAGISTHIPQSTNGEDSGIEGPGPGEEVAKATQSHLLVAAVPLPGVAWPVGEKVRCALVFHPLGEAKQHSEVVVGGLRGICCAVRTGRETGMAL